MSLEQRRPLTRSSTAPQTSDDLASPGKAPLLRRANTAPAAPGKVTAVEAAQAQPRNLVYQEENGNGAGYTRSEDGTKEIFAKGYHPEGNGGHFRYKNGPNGTEGGIGAEGAGNGGSIEFVNTTEEKSFAVSGKGAGGSGSLSGKRTADGVEGEAAVDVGEAGGSVGFVNTTEEKSLALSGHGGEVDAALALKKTADGVEGSASANVGDAGGSGELKWTKDEKSISGEGHAAGYGGSASIKKTADDTEVAASGQGAGIGAGFSASRKGGVKEVFASWASDIASASGKITREGMELAGEYTLWSTAISIPTGVPALNVMIDPSVKVAGEGSGNWGGENKGFIDVKAAVTGAVGVGISAGVANGIEAYITGGPSITGTFQYTRDPNGVTPAAPAPAEQEAAAAKTGAKAEATPAPAAAKVPWKLVGSANLSAGSRAGVKILGGLLDPHIDLGTIDVVTLTGIYFDQTGFRRDQLGFQWGEQIQKVFSFFQYNWQASQQIMAAASTKVAESSRRFREKVKNLFRRGKTRVSRAYRNVQELLGIVVKNPNENPAVVLDKVNNAPLAHPEQVEVEDGAAA